MTLIFTTFLRSLEPSGEPGDQTDFPALWQALRRALRRELRRRGLWESSPRLLGVDGSDEWGGRNVRRGWFPGDALDELATETYLRVFVSRLHSLRHHLQQKPNVEGLVFRAIRQVVHDVQKRHDPLGYRVFKFTRSALRSLLDRECLWITTEGTRITNRTMFVFEPGATRDPEVAERFEEAVGRWNDDLFPDVLLARGDDRQRRVLDLGERILELEQEGVRAFTFHDLVKPMKSDARQRWAALWKTSSGWESLGEDQGQLVQLVQPHNPIVERDRFEKLARCMDRRLKRLGGQNRTRNHRRRLWEFLRMFALTSIEGTPETSQKLDFEELPSKRELGRLLDIPRSRFPELFLDLENAVLRCQAELERREPADDTPKPVAPPVPSGDGTQLRTVLLERTTEAWHALQDGTPQRTPPRRGPVALAERRRDLRELAERRPARSTRRGRRWAASMALAASMAAVLVLWLGRPESSHPRGDSLPHVYLMADRVTRGPLDRPRLALEPEQRRGLIVLAIPTQPRPAHYELRRPGESMEGPPLWRASVGDRGSGEEALLLDFQGLEGPFRLLVVDTQRSEVMATYTFDVRRSAGP